MSSSLPGPHLDLNDKLFTSLLKHKRRELNTMNFQVSRTPHRRKAPLPIFFCVDQFRFDKYDIVVNEFINRQEENPIHTFVLDYMGTPTSLLTLEGNADKGFNLVYRENKVIAFARVD